MTELACFANAGTAGSNGKVAFFFQTLLVVGRRLCVDCTHNV